MAGSIDLNSDLGESFGSWRMGDDEAMLGAVSSANVACGFHGGDPATMLATCRTAAAAGVVVGAHPSFPDLVGFGRRHLNVSPSELAADTLYQLGALAGIAATASAAVRYVKPHGAMYAAVAADPDLAAAFAGAVAAFDRDLAVLGMPGSAVERAADDAGLRFVAEAFADRGYLPDGRLAPRSAEGALVTDPDTAARRVVRMLETGEVVAVDGGVVRLDAASVCVHGDTPGAVGIARAVRAALADAGVPVEPFA
ncbi:LamB/YcsF family protein [Agromyces sp. SYSU T00194]|uniref:LamB/YcsF family protein n=1 Tax=Agromyces chitinivorans TaxID=3158560 RepID=UPI003398FB30